MKTINDVLAMPKWIIELFIIIPLIILYGIIDGHYLWKAPIIELMLLYGVCWFIFRIIFTTIMLFSYTIMELILPLHFLLLTAVIYVCISYVFPSYTIGPTEVSQEEMAKSCTEARWTVFINYSYNNDLLRGSDSFKVFGNTQMAQEKSQKQIEQWFKNHPDKTYESHSIQLYYLPKDFVRKNRYPSFWFENPDKISDPSY